MAVFSASGRCASTKSLSLRAERCIEFGVQWQGRAAFGERAKF
ncbi:MAG: hypothetical protein JWS10_854 [Cypionkella sp.]|nr:hypothetical protein [Cypionkella sp.]